MKKTSEVLVHTSVRLPLGISRAVRRLAKQAGHRSASRIIRDIVNDYLLVQGIVAVQARRGGQ